MSAQSLRQAFHTELASTFIDDIHLLNSHYYYFLGKVDPWGSTDIPGTIPHVNSSQVDHSLRSNALYFKKISHNDVSLMAKRFNWAPNTLYAKWDHTLDMSSSMFYCMTDEFNVYKCLDNYSGALSTVKPTGQSFGHIKTSDGYTWKFMYNIPVFKRTKFLSLVNMPVQKAISDSFYNRGAVSRVLVQSSGSGYTDAQATYISVANTAAGSGASLSLSTNALTGTILSVNVISGGSGYTSGANIKVTSTAFGVDAILEAVIVSGIIQSVTVIEGGIGYSDSDTVAAIVGGAVIVPIISRITGEILDVTILDSGIGYTSPPALGVHVSVGQVDGTGAYGSNPSAIISAVIDNGKIVRVLISDPGKNYPTDLDTTITVSGDGEGAILTPVVYEGSVVSVIVEESGSGYTFIQAKVNGSGTGAIVSPLISTSDFNSNQSIVEQTAIKGSIYACQITNGGTNYSSGTTATVSGDGYGCEVSVIASGGIITHIVVDSIGSGYTYASITFHDPIRNIAPVGSIDASAYVILPPSRGHGKDAVVELFGNKMSIVSILKKENGLEKFNIEQEYRQYGILKNPSYLNSGKTFKLDYSLSVYIVSMASVDYLVEDEVLISDLARYRVVSFDSVAKTVTLQKLTDRSSALTSMVAESDSNRTYNVKAIISSPLMDKYSGRLLYISDEVPFTLSDEQNLIVKTLITL